LHEDKVLTDFDRVQGVSLFEEDIERHLIETVSPQAFAAGRDPDADFRILLTGAQERTAFLRWGGQGLAPRGATLTSNIFQLPLGLMGGLQDVCRQRMAVFAVAEGLRTARG
jgi:serine/threonine-protein kinase HipA